MPSNEIPLLEQARVLALIEHGARTGRLSYEAINEVLGDLSLDEAAAEELFEALEDRAILVVDEPRPENVTPTGSAGKSASKSVSTSRQATSLSKGSAAKPTSTKATSPNGDLDDVLASLDSLEDVMATRLDTWQEAILSDAALEEEEFNNGPVEDAYRQYMQRMANVARLTPEEELRLAKLARSGTPAEQEEARRRLVEANWRLVVFVARKYGERTTLPMLDIVQEGMVGLMRAVERFDPERGHRLSTYATWWIRQAINRAIGDQVRSMRLPGHIYAVMQKIRRVQSELSQGLGRSPSRIEIAEASGMPLSLVEEAMRASMQPLSLDSPVGEDEEMELSEIVSGVGEDEGEIRVSRSELHTSLEEVLEGLSDRERLVISLRFGIGDYAGTGPQTLDDIALQLKISRERVRQLEIRALRKLRRRSRGTPLADAFGSEE